MILAAASDALATGVQTIFRHDSGDFQLNSSKPKSIGTLCLASVLSFISPAFAQDHREPMPESQLRAMLPFGDGATLKYAVCGAKSYPTCTYVWGLPDSRDAARVKLGGKPEGDKLMTIFAQAHSPQDFDRVLASYSDAEPVDNLGVRAVWSAKRDQLSLITPDNMVIHVYVEVAGLPNPKETAVQVATFLLAEK